MPDPIETAANPATMDVVTGPTEATDGPHSAAATEARDPAEARNRSAATEARDPAGATDGPHSAAPTAPGGAAAEISSSGRSRRRIRVAGEPSLAPDARWEAARPTRVAVVGVGLVGSTFAYALLLSGLASEIVLIDVNHQRAEGEAMDLNHTVPFAHPTKIWAGTYEDCAGASVTVIAAGASQKPGETRLELVKRNASIFRQIVPQVAEHNPDGIIVVATNPVDVLTYLTLRVSGLPSARVFGSGTILDTARFRYLLSERLGVDPRSVHAYIVGEHGDSEVPVWSLANVAGMRLPVFTQENAST